MNTSELPTSVTNDPVSDRAFRTVLTRHVVVPLGFGMVTIIFFAVIIYYLLSLSRWVENTEEIVSDSNLLLQLLVDHETAVRGFVITGEEEFLEPYRQAERRVKPIIEKIQTSLDKGEKVQRGRLDSVYENYEQWLRYANTLIDMKRQNLTTAEIVNSRQGKRLTDQMRLLMAEFVTEAKMVKTGHRNQARMLVIVLSGAYFLISLLFSGLMAYGGRRQLRGLSQTYADLMRRQQEQTSALEQEAWLHAGESGVADCIIAQPSTLALAQSVLNFLTNYLGGRVGAVYLADNDDAFSRVADYGFSRAMASQEQTLAAGEGLVGQAANERTLMYLDDIKTSYFKVNSGLGEADPAALVLLPLLEEDRVIAVLELGFMRALDLKERELLERVSDNLGTAFAAARYRQRLRDMLLNVQQLNDELQSQQEELRVANEELEGQSQLLEESHARLETQRAELEESNLALMQQRQALRSKNETLLQTQQLLEEHARELERASRHKSEFIASMSHELRTPLNSQLILSHLLAENAQGNLTPEQVRNAKAVYAAGKDLLALINDVLDIAKIEVGKLEVRPSTTMLKDLLESLTAGFSVLAQEKNLDFRIHVDPDVAPELFTDRQRLEQILRNLLTNAIKFTERGHVHLEVTASEGGHIRFIVVDTGIGISEEAMDYVFDPFRQVDSGNARKFGGTGLGLSISRQLAALLGGSISATSVPGSGSSFTLDIPVTLTVTPSADQPEPMDVYVSAPPVELIDPPLRHVEDDRFTLTENEKTVLVIEDEVEFAKILHDLAHELNYQCLVATSAEEGLELALQFPLYAILLDMKLPDHSGMTVLGQLKANARLRHIPVHVISVEDRSEAALRMGAIGYLLKPASHEQLREVFFNIERRVARNFRQVLVVENECEQDRSLANLIAETDIEVTCTSTGAQVIELLKQRTFDCLIVDFELADMKSETLLHAMSAADLGSFPPVVIYAQRNLTPEEEASLLRYSHSIVVKGARSPERLLDEVMLFLHKVETNLSGEHRQLLQAARSPKRALEGRKILLVDDDVRNVFALTSALESRSASVEIARNGLEAVDKVKTVEDIDLILMDMMMPEMDGYQAMTEIRKDSRFRKLPIIAVTAKAMKDDQDRCLRAGANDYVAKPVDIDRLLSLIQVWLPKLKFSS
ncbi:MAG: response regulator [Gammaproteobacteria bacterium]|nr:response regulator [Gammaproteobacteria bacterium]